MVVAMVAMAVAITGGEDEGVVIKGDNQLKLPWVRIASISWVAAFPSWNGQSQ